MIARIWQARTRPGMGKAYYSYLEQTGLKEYRATEGCKDVIVLTQEIGDQTEYLLITLWESMEAVRRFAASTGEQTRAAIAARQRWFTLLGTLAGRIDVMRVLVILSRLKRSLRLKM